MIIYYNSLYLIPAAHLHLDAHQFLKLKAQSGE